MFFHYFDAVWANLTFPLSALKISPILIFIYVLFLDFFFVVQSNITSNFCKRASVLCCAGFLRKKKNYTTGEIK